MTGRVPQVPGGLFRVMLVALLAAGLAWVLLDPAQKRWVVEQMQGMDESAPTTAAPETAPVSEHLQQQQHPPPARETTAATKDDAREHRYATTADIDCRPATEEVGEREATGVYRWSDEQGRVHFGDERSRTDRADDLSGDYATGAPDYFSFRLEAGSGSLPPFFRDRLSADVEAIFRFLAGQLGEERLRRVPLHMKVFDDAAAFGALRERYAPGLEAATGFYAPADHLAVVLVQPDRADTLRLARHEATHVINAGLFGISPLWFEEGPAEYFSDYSSEALHREFRAAPWRLHYLAALHHQDALPETGHFMQLSRREWQALDPELAYSVSWSLIAWLLDHEEGRQWLRRYMARLARAPCEPESGVQQVNAHYPGGMENFERRWHQWVADRSASHRTAP